MCDKEGLFLVKDCLKYIDQFEELVKEIELLVVDVVFCYWEWLYVRIKEWIEDVLDESWFVIECVIFVDCFDIIEEIIRLKSYFVQFCDILVGGGVVGCKFDFFVQELNWEVNIIGLKVNDYQIIKFVVEMKSFIEKIKE